MAKEGRQSIIKDHQCPKGIGDRFAKVTTEGRDEMDREREARQAERKQKG